MGCAHCQPGLPVLDWEIQSGSCISTSNKDAASQISPPFTSVQVPCARPVLREFERVSSLQPEPNCNFYSKQHCSPQHVSHPPLVIAPSQET